MEVETYFAAVWCWMEEVLIEVPEYFLALVWILDSDQSFQTCLVIIPPGKMFGKDKYSGQFQQLVNLHSL